MMIINLKAPGCQFKYLNYLCLGNSEVSDDTVVTHILPQPAAESKR